MWATWPSAVTLDGVVESPDKLDAWFADIDKVVAYLRDTKRNAESYKASLEGNLDSLLRQATDEASKALKMPYLARRYDPTISRSWRTRSRASPNAAKAPDFLSVTKSNTLVVSEAKGSTTVDLPNSPSLS